MGFIDRMMHRIDEMENTTTTTTKSAIQAAALKRVATKGDGKRTQLNNKRKIRLNNTHIGFNHVRMKVFRMHIFI